MTDNDDAVILNQAEEQWRIEKQAEEDWRTEREPIDRAQAILPAWFVDRMMTDNWVFGLLLVTGQTLVIDNIQQIRYGAGGTWIDATMHQDFLGPRASAGMKTRHPWLTLMTAPTSRLKISINAEHVVAAFELADT